MRHTGTITKWNDDRGFGFITPRGGGEPVFVHIKSFENRAVRPVENEVVTYEISVDEQNRPRAETVEYSNPEMAVAAPRKGVRIALAVAVLVVVGIGVLCFFFGVPPLVAVWYLVWSLIAYGAYSVDKKIAQKDGWRVAESTLHLLALLGGWPGAFLVQRAFRHKIRKTSFMVGFWVTVAVNVGILVWVVSGFGD